jgi:uncharacterized protein YndB with AHSA1/START domain
LVEENKPSETAAPKKSVSRILKRGVIVLVAIIGLLAGILALQSDEMLIVRSATFTAPADKVFVQVDNYHNWKAWSPWAKMDPAAKNTFEGPEAGKGAAFSWDGNDKVGAGRMTTLESRPGELIRIKLEFTRPMQDTSITEFTFKPEGDKTVVTWSMSGRHTFLSKGICLFMNMDKIVGGQFEEGLANLRSIVETAGP